VAVFIDVIKAFDTVNHELLFELLEHYGVPPKMWQAIARI
jgi:hypothetical protein